MITETIRVGDKNTWHDFSEHSFSYEVGRRVSMCGVDGRQVDQGNLEGKREKTSERWGKREILQRSEDQLTEYGRYGAITDLKCYWNLLCSETEWGETGGEENRRNSEENKKHFRKLAQTLVISHCSRVQLFVTPWTVACQAPLSMGFSRQEHWSGLPFPSPGGLPEPGIETRVSWSSCTTGEVLTTEPLRKSQVICLSE